jgi:hypothetical protein
MVHNGKVVGHIDPQGGVTEYTNPFLFEPGVVTTSPLLTSPFVKAQAQKEKKKPPVNTRVFTDVEGYLKWVTEEWDPINEAMGLVDLTVEKM